MDPSNPPNPSNISKQIVLQVEIWQYQSYWQIKGWSAPPRSQPQYTCNLIPSGVSENFPEDLNPPSGWDWHDKWSVDVSSVLGEPDINGWYFAPNYEKLKESIDNMTASGQSTKNARVRARRWIRHVVCISPELEKKIHDRIEEIIKQRQHIETIFKEKDDIYRSIKFYEENRSFVFAQSLHLATQGILNTLSVLKELINKLKLLKQFLSDRIEMEKEYSTNLDALSKRYWLKSNPSEPISPSAVTNQMLQRQASLQKLIDDPTSVHETSSAATTIPSASDTGVLQCANIFFSGFSRASEAICNSKSAFVANLIQLMNTEAEELLAEVQNVLKESRGTFRKNSDICRLSEAAIGNFASSLQIAFESVSSFAMEEITSLTEELTLLRGGCPFQPYLFEHLMKPPIDEQADIINPNLSDSSPPGAPPITSSSPGSIARKQHRKKIQREDMWLAVQRYKVAVRDSQEALCVLISESMDLELQQQILTNRVHNMFVYVLDNYFNEELTLSSDTDIIFTRLMKSVQEQIERIGVPNPILQSPFAKLNPALALLSSSNDSNDHINIRNSISVPIDKDKDKDKANDGSNNNDDDSSAKEYDDFINSVGIFSFTTLFKEPLPMNPGVIKSGFLLTIRPSELLPARKTPTSSSPSPIPFEPPEPTSFDPVIWKDTYVVATSDGYVHIIYGRKSDIPTRSFYMKSSYLNDTVNHQLPSNDCIFEIFMMSTAINEQSKKNGTVRRASARILEGLYLQAKNKDEKEQWIHAIKNLTSLPIYVDDIIEKEATESMLESLPILRGETAKIDLEMKNYEKYIQENPPPTTMTSSSRIQSLSGDDRDSTTGVASASTVLFRQSPDPLPPSTTLLSEGIATALPFTNVASTDAVNGSADSALSNENPAVTLQVEKEAVNHHTTEIVTSFDDHEDDGILSAPSTLQTPSHKIERAELKEFFSREGNDDSDSDVISPVFKHLTPLIPNQTDTMTVKELTSVSPLQPVKLSESEDTQSTSVNRDFYLSKSEDVASRDDADDSLFRYSKSYYHLPGQRPSDATLEDVKEEEHGEEEKEEVIVTSSHVNEEKSEIDSVAMTSIPSSNAVAVVDMTSDLSESSKSNDFFNTNPNLRYETDSDDDTDVSSRGRAKKAATNPSSPAVVKGPRTLTPTTSAYNMTSSVSGSGNKRLTSSGSKSAYGGFNYSATSNESWIKYDNNRRVFEKNTPSPGSAGGGGVGSNNNHLFRPPSMSSMTSTTYNKPPQSQLVGIVPVAEIKPKQIIPVTDTSMPLAKRHSQMIKQYEQGLQRERQKASLKVKESKREHLADVIELVIDPTTLTQIAEEEENDVTTSNTTAGVTNLSNREAAKSILRGSSPVIFAGEINTEGYNHVNTSNTGNVSRSSSYASLVDLGANSTDSASVTPGPGMTSGGGIGVADDVDQLLPNLVTGKKIVKRLTEKFDK